MADQNIRSPGTPRLHELRNCPRPGDRIELSEGVIEKVVSNPQLTPVLRTDT